MTFRVRTALFTTTILATICLGWGPGLKAAEARPEMTDQDISDKIEDQLLFDPGVNQQKSM
jgi:hypothetical protein